MNNIKNDTVSIPGGPKPQIAAELFIKMLGSMKNLLTMGEFKYSDKGGRNSEGYKFFKKNVMDEFYKSMQDFFKGMEHCGLFVKCTCGASIEKRNGWKECEFCHGSGYKNSYLLNSAVEEYTQQMKKNNFS